MPIPLNALDQIGTIARTLHSLHPLQILARPYSVGAAKLIRDVPAGAPPRVCASLPVTPDALRELREAERTRWLQRRPRLAAGTPLRAFEETYGLDLQDPSAHESWHTPVASRPYPASVRARSLAVAIRMGNRGWETELARACRAVLLQPELHLLGNHLLENGIGLACGGAITSGPESDAWWKVGSTILDWQLREQFLDDGGHFERSAAYHLAITAGLLELIELTRAAGKRTVPRSWERVAARALTWADRVIGPDGTIPLLNDATLDSSPSFAHVAALARAVGIEWHRPKQEAVTHFASTGWVIARTEDAFLVVDAGADGAAYQPGHAHADALSFEAWIHGRRTVVDFGVSSYEVGPERARTRATRSHNTVDLSGHDSSEVWSAFRVGRRCTAEVLSIESDAASIRIRARHDGYRWMAGCPWHERELELSPGRLVVRDRITGGNACAVSHLRLDSEAAEGVRVSFSGRSASNRPDAWYPCFAEPTKAVVYEAGLGVGNRGEWSIEW